jgi:hypothetical protein
MRSKTGLRHLGFGAAFAILISPNSVLVLYFGLIGSSGNSIVTGSLLTAATLAVGLLCFRRDLVFQPADCLFLALLLCIASSLALNGWTSNAKEYQLLVLSLAAYPACRFISRVDVVSSRSSFIWATGIIVLLGSIVTARALLEQGHDLHGQPYVLGFGAAATHFLGSLSFLILALVTARKPTVRRTALVSVLIFLPTAIFAASIVRFTFIALAGGFCLAIILTEAKQRGHVIAVALIVLIAIATGLIARSSSNASMIYADYVIKELTGDVEPGKKEPAGDVAPGKREPAGDVGPVKRESAGDVDLVKLPSCYLAVNLDNSISVRKMIARDALALIPSAGWIGLGLDSFEKLSCIKLEVHNSFLQAAVEFGWLGGLLLILLIGFAGGPILIAARDDGALRFVLCSLAFIVLMSLAHGRISRDAVLFAFLGCAVGLKETSRVSRQAS